MSRNAPAFTPMCNKILRFYFSNPNRENFPNELARRQFEAARDSLSKASHWDVELLRSVIPFNNGNRDLLDSYIAHRLDALGMDGYAKSQFYDLLRNVNYRIALTLGFVESTREKESLGWCFYNYSEGRREHYE